MQNQKKSFPNSGKFDPINSTYKHIIYLKNKIVLTGYSKGLSVNEPSDKIVLLQRVILRLSNSGYFQHDKTAKIEFYLKSFMNNQDELILTLTPDTFTLGNNSQYTLDERLISFLEKFYDQLGSNKIVTDQVKPKNSKNSEETLFSLAMRTFKTELDLLKYGFSLIKMGYPDGQVEQYIIKYKQKYPFNQ